jgi:hypothetical protein
MTKLSKNKRDLLENALFTWYFEKCHFPKDEAKHYTQRFIEELIKEITKEITKEHEFIDDDGSRLCHCCHKVLDESDYDEICKECE